jgi:hypothetical protein
MASLPFAPGETVGARAVYVPLREQLHEIAPLGRELLI